MCDCGIPPSHFECASRQPGAAARAGAGPGSRNDSERRACAGHEVADDGGAGCEQRRIARVRASGAGGSGEGRVAHPGAQLGHVCAGTLGEAHKCRPLFSLRSLGGEENAYQQALVRALKGLGEEHGLRISNWIDPRPAAEQGEPWCELVQAIQTSQIDGLICPIVDLPHLNWLDKLQIPRVFSSSAPGPRCLYTDLSQLAQLSVQAAVDQGARSIGILSPLDIDGPNPDRIPNPHQEFYLEFISEAHAKGLTVHNEWVLTGKDEDGSREQKMWGYRRMHDLWSQPTHPEALVVYPDTAAEGVVTALLELGVRVPQDLKLVFHKNDETPLFCPMPAEFIVLSLRDVATALIDAVEAQFYGKPHALKPSGFSRQGSPAMQKTQ